MFSYRYTILPLLLLKKWSAKHKAVLAPRGMLQKGAMQFGKLKKTIFLKTLHLLGITKNICFQATDVQEKNDIQYYFKSAKSVTLLTNFSKELPAAYTPISKQAGVLNIVFLSRIVEKKNLLFAIETIKQLPESLNVLFTIYGDIGDAIYWNTCKNAIEDNRNTNTTIQYKGPIANEFVAEKLSASHLFFLPSFGENFGHAIFESFSAGRPVLISNQTPWQHVEEQKAGWCFPLSNKASFIQTLEKIAKMEQQEYDTYCKGAFDLAKNYYKDTDLKEKYFQLFS